jgi:putative transposase
MARRKIYDREHHAFFVTFSCYRRRRLLDDDRAKRIVLGALNAQLHRLAGQCVGFVLMPNHVHALVWFPQSGQLSEFMKQWKRTSSVRIGRLLESEWTSYASRIDKSPVWQAKYYVFNVYSRAKLEEKLNYMHLNPVRAGLVERPGQWRWSSARYYESKKSVGVPIGWLD